MNMHRLFIGIQVPADTAKQMVAWQNEYSQLPVYWVPPDDLHVTLIPPWEAEDLERVKDMLDTFTTDITLPELILTEVSYGTRPAAPRVIWVKGPTPRRLIDIRDELEKHMFDEQHLQSLMLHVTLARFNTKRFASFPIKKLEEKVHWSFTPTNIHLFETLPENNVGSRYVVRHEIPIT